jgi:hypothetical protein
MSSSAGPVVPQPASASDGGEAGELPSTPERVTLTGRPDIDTAVLLALQHAMPGDPSLPVPRQAEVGQDQPAMGDPAFIEDATNREPSALDGRSDIDSAMLVALQQAMPGDQSFSMPGDTAPGGSQLGAVSPPGEG